ncbi:AaceriABL149Wp [[Ashbya] aceris (nom. inval.)]|nr:AaceriABL149Wp [[Ashbya] aceris (nom. inval.)]
MSTSSGRPRGHQDPMGSAYLPSKKSRLMSENRVSKINRLYEDVQKRKSRPGAEHAHRDSVVSNSSTSVLTVEGGLEDVTMLQGLLDRGPRAYGDLTLRPPAVRPVRPRALSPGRLREGLQSPLTSDADSMADEEDDLKLTPKLRSRRSIIRMSAESTPYRHAPEERMRPTNKKNTTRMQLRSQLGQPLPLGYIAHAAARPRADDTHRVDLESRLRNIMQKDRTSFEKRLQQIRQGYHDLPIGLQDDALSLQNKTREIEASETTIPFRDNTSVVAETEDLRSELNRHAQKLDEVLTLLRSTPTNSHVELIAWSACVIILILCNVYVYYYFP